METLALVPSDHTHQQCNCNVKAGMMVGRARVKARTQIRLALIKQRRLTWWQPNLAHEGPRRLPTPFLRHSGPGSEWTHDSREHADHRRACLYLCQNRQYNQQHNSFMSLPRKRHLRCWLFRVKQITPCWGCPGLRSAHASSTVSFPTVTQLHYMIETNPWAKVLWSSSRSPQSRCICLWSCSWLCSRRLLYGLICSRKLLGGGLGVIVPVLIALVFFTCLVDTGVNVGHENTDGFLDGRL